MSRLHNCCLSDRLLYKKAQLTQR